MKIHPEKLSSSLQQSLAPLYIISGDETLLINEAADLVRTAAKLQGYREREVFHADTGKADWESILQSLNSMSLFSEKKLVEIRCNKKTLNEELFLNYWKNPNPDVIVVVLVEKIDKATTNTKWFGVLENAGAFVQIWPMDEAQLPRWLIQRAKQQGLSIDNQGIRMLLERTEGNLLASVQELEKLFLLYGKETISPEQLMEAVSDSARYDIFKLADAALAGNPGGTLKILRGLLEEGTAETMILWTLTKDLRILASVSEAVKGGQQANAALFKHGVWEKRQPLFNQTLKRLPGKKIHQLLQQANQIDQSIKGMQNKNPRDELETLCLSLAGTRVAC